MGRPLLDAGVAEPVPQPLAKRLGLLWGGDTMGTELSVWGFLGPGSGPGGAPCPPADTVLTFRKGGVLATGPPVKSLECFARARNSFVVKELYF